MRIRLDIAYDGTHFHGWARQPGLRTVQGILEQALERVLRAPAPLTVAGRTDAGVHALGQVAHADLDDGQWRRATALRRGAEQEADPISALARRLRGVLRSDPDVVVTATSTAPVGFDARFSAVWRRYTYRIADDITGDDPLDRHHRTRVHAALDAEEMDAAARRLIGLHDFAAFCKPRPEATTIRTLVDFGWQRDAAGVLVATIIADAFCHSMVRALVGACVAVGQGRMAPDRLDDIRDARERTSDFTVLAARGLILNEVGYPADELLAARAERTRNRRDSEDTPHI